MPRLVAVLGYSAPARRAMHPVCAARLAAAEPAADGADAVLLSGWSRRPGRASEAALMQAAWRGPNVPLLDDGDARTTLGNARAVAAAAKAIGATEVVVVTSSWHRLRGASLVRAALGPDVTARARLTRSARGRCTCVGRELVCLLALPFQLRALR